MEGAVVAVVEAVEAEVAAADGRRHALESPRKPAATVVVEMAAEAIAAGAPTGIAPLPHHQPYKPSWCCRGLWMYSHGIRNEDTMIRLAKRTQSTADAVVSQTYGIRSVHTSVSQGKSICSNTLKLFFSFSFSSFYFYYLVFCLPSLLFVFLQHSVFSGGSNATSH